jgi:hypothetical protein
MASSFDSRVIFDAILQSAAVGLFHSLNIALAPMPREADYLEPGKDDRVLATFRTLRGIVTISTRARCHRSDGTELLRIGMRVQ